MGIIGIICVIGLAAYFMPSAIKFAESFVKFNSNR